MEEALPAPDEGRVLVAMSGGVDSAVAAGLLVEAGYDVLACTLHLWDAPEAQRIGRCCAPEDRDDARRVCEALGVPHYVIDERGSFERDVVQPFVEGYKRGETPLPCAQCNSFVKLDKLLEVADALGARWVATGHYARLARQGAARVVCAGQDPRKDQSYFLYGLSAALRERLLFPVGHLEKAQVREEAERLALPVARKPDSQELCFVPDGDIAGFMRARGEALPGGTLRDARTGQTLGHHQGKRVLTVGQRRGVALSGQQKPRYVLDVLPSGDVEVGNKEALFRQDLEVETAVWQRKPETAIFEARVKVRHRHTPAEARVELTDKGFRVRFAEAQRALTPGQAAVLYVEDAVVGGGTIARAPQRATA